MKHKTQKLVAAIHDLSGYGRCSLTVAIPVLSAMGHQCCPLPTSIFSNHTGFPVYYFDDFTSKMTAYVDKWVELGLHFDGILTGFLGSAEQIEIVINTVERLKADGTHVIIDPAFGDGGVLYPTCTEELCEEMKTLVGIADVMVPNVTECCVLTGTPYKERGWTRKELLDMAVKLQIMGAKSVVITGIHEGSFIANMVLERGEREPKIIRMKSAGQTRPGTGDVFSSVLAGALLNGSTLYDSAKLAAGFVKDCIVRSDELEIPLLNGVCFEQLLSKLIPSKR